ncbi:unnamed protein product, partial [Mesorhabditis belari]|uniref:Myosin motor domain-containing protein n=1 Tax=Mesorhabditis belari TaxID=2138241 RepID=A0AAF3FCB4_9BILA
MEALMKHLKFPESRKGDDDLDGHQKKIWIPDPELGFRLCAVLDESGRDVSVGFRDSQGFFEKKRLPHSSCYPVSRNSGSDDLCALSEPNVATVLDSLHKRYSADVIHTYSGLFCLFINPWKSLPIYKKEIMDVYRSKLDLSLPPHVFAVAQTAYDGVKRGGTNQSILITGESGSGKTENTKHIIEFVLNSCGAVAQTVGQELISCGELLEAFGNAATTANGNSSRFGKFIRIEFDVDGKMHSASVECYLLEKSRVVNQNGGERNFHIFHQILEGGFGKKLKDSLGLKEDASKYRYVNGGGEYSEEIDDEANGKITDAAFRRLGFSDDERLHVLEIVAACILLGEIEFRERTGLDLSYVEGTQELEAVSSLLGVRGSILADALCQPAIKIGENTIRKNQNLRKTLNSVAALSKTLYERLFRWILEKCNQAIGHQTENIQTNQLLRMIGVLDIAGFEILQKNSFEQLCINYTNEKLQQFFNRFMFIKEQTTYLEEGLKWTQTDFAYDLQPTITLIEKPLGILNLLEEECVVPNGSESAFLEKSAEHLKDSPEFAKSRHSQKSQVLSHFSIRHYAGNVDYNLDGWLEKNRDSVDTSILSTMHESVHQLVAKLFPSVDESAKPRKGGLLTSTVTYVYKSQLSSLLESLNQSSAHFIRCLLPNRNKQPGVINSALLLHQLRCNGVFEGIRICRQGYPNRLPFDEFVARYEILSQQKFPKKNRAAARELCDLLEIDEDRVQVGSTRVFCKVGVITELEDRRRNHLNSMITTIQTEIRTFLAMRDSKMRERKQDAMEMIQWNVRCFNQISQWPWHRILTLVHPLIPREREKERIVELEKKLLEFEKERQKMHDDNRELCTAMQRLRDSQSREVRKADEAKKIAEKMLEDKTRELHEVKTEMYSNAEIFDLLESKYQLQQKKIGEMTEILRDYERRFEKLDYESKEREKELHRTKEHLDEEKKRSGELQSELIETQGTLKEMEERMEIMLKEERRLVETVARLMNARDESDDRAKRQNDLITELQQTIEDLNGRMAKADSHVNEERQQRRKIEKEFEKSKEENEAIKAEAEKMIEKYDVLKEQLKDKEAMLKRLEKKISEKDSLMEECIKDLKESHRHRVDQLNGQIDDMRRKNSKLENENICQKGLLERADSQVGLSHLGRSIDRENSFDSEFGRSSSGRMSMSQHSLCRQYSICSVPSFSSMRALVRRRETEPDLYQGLSRVPSMTSVAEHQRKIQELERQLQDAKTEVNLKMRELDVYKSELHSMEQEKESISRHNKTQQGEIERLTRKVGSLSRTNQDLEHRVKKANEDCEEWKKKMEESLVEQRLALEEHRKRTMERYEESQHAKDLKSSRVTALERSKEELQTQLTQCQLDLDRAMAQVADLERTMSTQETLGRTWESEYHSACSEVESLRDENCALKSKIRRQWKQIEILTRQEDNETALNSLQEKVDKLNGRME